MDKEGNNYYQSCRKCAGLTQDEAAELLFISKSHLQKIETDERVPSDDIVDMMSYVYHAPLLAWWHLKKHNPLGHHLPDVQPPSSDCDIAFQSILMNDEVAEANSIIKQLLKDGEITEDEFEEYQRYKMLIQTATNRGASIGTYRKE